jgi:hypothetical protein
MENIWTCKRRTLLNKNKHGDQGHITSGRYCKIYKIPQSKWYGKSTYQPTNELKMHFMTSIILLHILALGCHPQGDF